MIPPLSPEDRAEKITPCWQPAIENCQCPAHVYRPQIADQIREAVEEARKDVKLECDVSYEWGWKEAIERAAKVTESLTIIDWQWEKDQTTLKLKIAERIRSLKVGEGT